MTVIHSRTGNPEKICREADIVIAAAGSAHMVKRSWIKKGAAIIDVVGLDPVAAVSKAPGFRFLCTNVHRAPRRSHGRQ